MQHYRARKISVGACKGAAIFVPGKLKIFGLVLDFINIIIFSLSF